MCANHGTVGIDGTALEGQVVQGVFHTVEVDDLTATPTLVGILIEIDVTVVQLVAHEVNLLEG